MRILFTLGLSAILSATLVGTPAVASPANPVSAPLGMVLQADSAQVGADITSGGSTIYDGDRLQTGGGGALRARLGGPQLYLSENTTAQVHGLSNGFQAELGAGTVVVSAAAGQTFRLIADGATIRPVGPQGTVAEITRINANEVMLTSTRGAIEVSMDDEVKTIEAGSTYRMEVESEDASPQNGTIHTGRNHRMVFWLIVGGVAAATGVLIWRALVSPSGF